MKCSIIPLMICSEKKSLAANLSIDCVLEWQSIVHAASQWCVASLNCRAADGGDVKGFREFFHILKVLTSLILFVFLQDFSQIKVKTIKIGAASKICFCIICCSIPNLKILCIKLLLSIFFPFFACVFLPYTHKDCNSEYLPKTYQA